jgi:1,4-dihydroxy-2-naphthoate octaprenyltransferase
VRLIDFFFALRPLVFVPAWSFFILGYGLGQDAHSDTPPFPWLRFLLLSLILAGVHLVNQIADFEADRVNGKGFFLQRGIFSRRLYAGVAGVCLVLGLGIAWARSESPGLLAATAALGLAYSFPPLRLSARPGFDLLANAFGYGALALLLGAGNTTSFAAPWELRVACCTLAVGAVFLHTTLLDLDGDRRTGKTTSGLALGAARTRPAAALLALAGTVAAARAGAPVLLFAGAALALLTAAAATRPDRVSSRTICVAGTGLFALAAGACIPLFPACVALLVVITRLFYKRRFALAYPAL